MQKFFFSVLDTKARIFFNPFTSVNQSTALRDLQREVNRPMSDIGAAPSDYVLFEIGSFDDNTGTIAAHSTPINLGPASQFEILT